VLASLLLLATIVPGARAQEEPPGPPPADFAFASHLGTGVYSVSGQRVYVLRIPVSFWIDKDGPGGWGIRMLLPVTAGFHDFQASDVFQGVFPDDVATLSIVPGVEFRKWVRKNWRLRPYAHLGAGKDLEGGDLTLIYDAGVKSRIVFPWKRWEFAVGNDLMYAGATAIDGGATSFFVRLDTGFDARRPMGFRVKKREPFGSVFVIDHFYVDPAEFAAPVEEISVGNTVEFGFALGLEPPAKMLGIRIPQVGLSYEFGPDLRALKINMGFRY
jgi:hypothetical protein